MVDFDWIFDVFLFVIYVRSNDLDLFFDKMLLAKQKSARLFDKIHLAKECFFFWQSKTKSVGQPNAQLSQTSRLPNIRISSAKKLSGSGTITWSRTSSIFRWCFSRLHRSLGISPGHRCRGEKPSAWWFPTCLFACFVKPVKLRKMCENDFKNYWS